MIPVHTAFVLAAGFGTRLRPLTEHLPKPLVPVCGVPLLRYTLALCARHGLTEVIVNAHHLAGALEPWSGEHDGVRVTVVVEPEILGTGGGLRHVRDRLDERFVVLNGDVLHDVDLTTLREAVRPDGAAMALRRHGDAATYGIVAADATGTVVRLRELASAAPEGPVAHDTHFTGIHAMARSTLELVPEGFACIVRSAYIALVPQRRVAAVPYVGTWLDTGDPQTYLDANLALLSGRVRLALDPHGEAAAARDGTGREVGELPEVAVGPVWIGRGAHVAGRVANSVIGHRAVVPAGATLTGCVVWDDVEVPHGDHVRTVFHPGGAIVVT